MLSKVLRKPSAVEAAWAALRVAYRSSLIQRQRCSTGIIPGFGIRAIATVPKGTVLVRVPLHACVSPCAISFVPEGAWLLDAVHEVYRPPGTTDVAARLAIHGRDVATTAFVAAQLHWGPLHGILSAVRSEADACGGIPSLSASEILARLPVTDRDQLPDSLITTINRLGVDRENALADAFDHLRSQVVVNPAKGVSSGFVQQLRQLSWDDFTWAHRLLQSRSNSVALHAFDSGEQSVDAQATWIPFIDYVNHTDAIPNVTLGFGETRNGSKVVLLVAQRDIPAGDELVYRYVEPPQHQPNPMLNTAEFVLRFGFLPYVLKG